MFLIAFRVVSVALVMCGGGEAKVFRILSSSYWFLNLMLASNVPVWVGRNRGRSIGWKAQQGIGAFGFMLLLLRIILSSHANILRTTIRSIITHT